MKDIFTILGGVISFLNLAWFGIEIWRRRVPPQSSASWLMWVLLDGVVLGSTIAAGKPFWLPLSYTLGALAVTLALFKRGKWTWSHMETFCAFGACVAAFLWYKWNAAIGIFAGMTAMTFAGIPVMVEMFKTPIRATLPVWAVTVVACACTLFGSDWTMAGTMLAWGGISFNGIMSVLVLRRK